VWSVEVIARSIAIDTALILVGCGLLLVRRWAALMLSIMAAALGFSSFYTYAKYRSEFMVSATVGLVVLLVPAVLTAIFWRSLVRGKWHDMFYVFMAVAVSTVTDYAAYANRPASIPFHR
jgi:predicted Abi (CAAX) family protease